MNTGFTMKHKKSRFSPHDFGFLLKILTRSPFHLFLKGHLPILFTLFLLIALSGNLLGQNRAQKAIETFKDSLRLVSSSEETLRLFHKLGKAYRYVNQDSAWLYGKKGLALGEQLNDTIGIFMALQNIGILMYRQGKYEEASTYLLDALGRAQQLQSIDLQREAHNSMGMVYLQTGSYKKALDAFMNSIQLQESDKPDHIQIAATINVGVTYGHLEEEHKALEYYQRARRLSQLRRDTMPLIQILNNIGAVYDRWEQYDTTFYYYKKAFDLVKTFKGGNAYIEAALLHNIGQVLYKEKKYSQSETYLSQSLAVCNKHHFQLIECNAYSSFAQLYIEQHKYALAIEMARKGYDVAQEIESFQSARECTETLYQAYEQLGKWDSAFRYLMAYEVYEDSLDQKKQDGEIKKLIINHDVAQRDRELAFQKTLLDKEKKQNRRLIFSIMVLVTLISLLAYLGLRVRKANRLLEGQNQRIEGQRLQLTELNQFKDRIFSIMAHDIRGPLSNISGLMEILMEGPIPAADREKLAEKIQKQVRETFSIFDNLFLWSRGQLTQSQSGKAINLHKVVQHSIDSAAENAQRKDITLISAISPDIEVWANEGLLLTVLRNLLSNGIKFTPSGGTINLKAIPVGQHVQLSIQDTGRGIPLEKQHTLFDLQQNESLPGTADERGTGLGLPITREFVERNGG